MKTHTYPEGKGETEENRAMQMNNFDGLGERPREISNPWYLPVYFNGYIWLFVPQCLQKRKHVSVKLIVYSTLLN